jgi:S-adenosylmethionine:tRNA ribosyltransferase-isomerase
LIITHGLKAVRVIERGPKFKGPGKTQIEARGRIGSIFLRQLFFITEDLPAFAVSPSLTRRVETSRFDYSLPDEAIAQVPAENRDQSRLLLVNRSTGQVADHFFRELPDLLPRTASCFRNNVKVMKGRIFANREGGGRTECLLLHPDNKAPSTDWWCLLKPGKRLPAGATFHKDGVFEAVVIDKNDEGMAHIRFKLENHDSVFEMAEEAGEMPLPPYISRSGDDSRKLEDDERYQTVYADPNKPFGAAAPTAGLHFTPTVLNRMIEGGNRFHDLTLHVGLGTFKPIQTELVESHTMHEEHYELPPATREALHDKTDRMKLAVGTTSLRAMEHYFRQSRKARKAPDGPFTGNADLFIYPPDTFTTDALLTNFHLPRSTLLCLVSAFLTPGSTDGIEWLKQLYQAALKRNYRFYSYGDAMLIL